MDETKAGAVSLAVDLFCGLGGWTEGLLAEGYDVVGFDIEAHRYGDAQYSTPTGRMRYLMAQRVRRRKRR